ncbi:MAG: hypothetical protein Tsb0015_04820 [Simkaniaceae bacterium]
MQRKMVALLLGSACMSQIAFADTESRLSDLERQMEQIRVVTPNETCGVKTALARPLLDECDGCCGDSWWINIAPIFWHAKAGGTQYAYTDSSNVNTLDKGRIKKIDFQWDWGIKAGLGHNFAHDGWDLSAQYTYFSTSGTDAVRVPPSSPGNVTPLKGFLNMDEGGDVVVLSVGKAQSQFEINFQAVDVKLGREFYVSEFLALHPFFGLKAGIFDMLQTTRYYGGDLGNNAYHVHDDSDFWGVGALAGMDGSFYMGKGFSIFGSWMADLIYGKVDVEFRDHYSLGGINKRKMKDVRHSFVPALEMMLGLQYDTYFWQDQKHLRLRFSYESQYWWRVNQSLEAFSMTTTQPGFQGIERYRPVSEDLSFHGFTLEVRIDF